MLVIGGCAMLGLSSLFDHDKKIPFLSQSLTSMLTYVWSRRNPSIRINFLGVFTFDAPYLPWALIAFSLFIHGNTPWSDVLGVAVGHSYYYLEDVYPNLPGSHGHRPLATPTIIQLLLHSANRDAADPNIPDALIQDAE